MLRKTAGTPTADTTRAPIRDATQTVIFLYLFISAPRIILSHLPRHLFRGPFCPEGLDAPVSARARLSPRDRFFLRAAFAYPVQDPRAKSPGFTVLIKRDAVLSTGFSRYTDYRARLRHSRSRCSLPSLNKYFQNAYRCSLAEYSIVKGALALQRLCPSPLCPPPHHPRNILRILEAIVVVALSANETTPREIDHRNSRRLRMPFSCSSTQRRRHVRVAGVRPARERRPQGARRLADHASRRARARQSKESLVRLSLWHWLRESVCGRGLGERVGCAAKKATARSPRPVDK